MRKINAMKPLISLLLFLICCLVPATAQAQSARTDSARTSSPDAAKKAEADSSSVKLNEATVTGTKLMFVTKKDTVVYNMDALAATKGDMLGDMIGKMPGLEMRKDGLYFKGKKVSRLMVNGTDFVRGNTQSGLDNLPAYIIKHVKAYESITDQTRITGIDDGVREMVVDVILKKEFLGEWTGNASMGYGTDDRWRARAFANSFANHYRLTAFGGFTNTGQFQSADTDGNWGDNGGAGSSSGDTRFMRPGMSMMWNNGRSSDAAGYVKIEGGLTWDYRDHKDYFYQENEVFLGDGTSKYGASDQRTKNDEKIISTNLYLTWKPSENTHLEFSPSYSHTHQTDRSHERSGNWNVPAYEMAPSVLDSLEAHPETGWPANDGTVYAQRGTSGYDNLRHSYRHNLWMSQKLTERNLRLTLRHNLGLGFMDGEQHSLNRYDYYQPATGGMDPLYNRFRRTDNDDFYQMSFVDLNVPVPALQSLRLTYGFSNGRIKNRADGYRLERLGGIFADYADYLAHFGQLPEASGWEAEAIDPDITLHTTITNRWHWAEAELSYKKNGLLATAKVLGKRGHEAMDYDRPGYDPLHPGRNATEWRVNGGLRYETDSAGTYTLNYSMDRHPQALMNEIDIPDRSNPLNIRLGNPNMPDETMHNVNLGYSRTFKQNRWMSVYASWSMNRHFATMRSTYDKQTGITTSQPFTLCGQWGTSVTLNFGTPLDKKQHFSFMGYVNYNLNHEPDFTLATDGNPLRRSDTNHNLTVYAFLNSRFDKFFASLTLSATYDGYRSDLATNRDTWSGNYSASVQYTFPLDIELKTAIQVYHRPVHHSQGIRPLKPIWNATLTRSFLRDKSLTLQFEASDILDRRDQSNAFVSVSNRSAFYAECVSRYFMLSAIYHFSTKKK